MVRNGEADNCYGVSHKAICPLLKQCWLVSKGKATVESAGLRGEMAKFLRAAVAAGMRASRCPPAPPPAGGNEGAA